MRWINQRQQCVYQTVIEKIIYGGVGMDWTKRISGGEESTIKQDSPVVLLAFLETFRSTSLAKSEVDDMIEEIKRKATSPRKGNQFKPYIDLTSPAISLFGFELLVDAWNKKNLLHGTAGLVWALMSFSWKVVVFIPRVVEFLVHAAELGLWQYHDNQSNPTFFRYAAALLAIVLGIVHLILRQIFSPEQATLAAASSAEDVAKWMGLEKEDTGTKILAGVFMLMSFALSLVLNIIFAKLILLPAVALLLAIGLPTAVVAVIVGGPLYVLSHFVPKIASIFTVLGSHFKEIANKIGAALKVDSRIQAGSPSLSSHSISSTAVIMDRAQMMVTKLVVQGREKTPAAEPSSIEWSEPSRGDEIDNLNMPEFERDNDGEYILKIDKLDDSDDDVVELTDSDNDIDSTPVGISTTTEKRIHMGDHNTPKNKHRTQRVGLSSHATVSTRAAILDQKNDSVPEVNRHNATDNNNTDNNNRNSDNDSVDLMPKNGR